MSHISEYKCLVKDRTALAKVLSKRGYGYRQGNIVVEQYGRNRINAELGFKIPGWKYEIAVTDKGKVLYDHWGSESGTMELLGETLQDYNEEVISAAALMEADNFYTEKLKDGSKKITLEWN